MPATRQYLSCAVLLGSVCFLAGCPPGSSPSPPGVNAVIQLGSPPPDTTNNGISISTGDVTRSAIPGQYSIRLIATAVDAQSKVTAIAVESRLDWQCSFGHGSQTIGPAQNGPLVFTPAITTTPNSTVQNIDSVVNIVAMTGCDTSKPGRGPVNTRGSLRVTATNGAGLTTTSSAFTFYYQNVGAVQ